jgi:hypothetical protein
MKRSTNSQSGFVRLTLVFVCVILLLFGLGAQGIYVAIKNRNPAVMSCEDYSRTRPKAAWLAITNCVLDLSSAAYETLKYQNMEVPTELFIPVRSASERQPAKDTILLATRDPELMKVLREMESVPSGEEFKEWLARNADRVLVRRDVQGLVQFGVELDKQQRRKLARLQDNLAPDFIILDEGRRPEIKQSVGYLALGAVMVVVSIVFVRRTREPAPAETY